MKSIISQKIIVIIISFLMLVLLGWYVISNLNDAAKEMFPDKTASEFYSEDQYFGIVHDKFIDKEQHNYKTVIIHNKLEERRVLFDFEIGGLYEFIEIGDSISKEKHSLEFRLVRENLDTIIHMEIFDKPK